MGALWLRGTGEGQGVIERGGERPGVEGVEHDVDKRRARWQIIEQFAGRMGVLAELLNALGCEQGRARSKAAERDEGQKS